MIAIAVAAAIAQTDRPTASALVSRMLAYYRDAKSLKGEIVLTQRAGQVAVVVETSVAYDEPSKLLIRQVRRSAANPGAWLVTSDGTNFSYDAPASVAKRPGERLIEKVSSGNRTFSVADIYATASNSLGDRSAALDIAIARSEDLRFLTGQWATLAYQEPREVAGVRVQVVGGDWREYSAAAVSGKYELWITLGGELKRVVQRETIAPDPRLGAQTVVSTWDVDLERNPKLDPGTFKLAR